MSSHASPQLVSTDSASSDRLAPAVSAYFLTNAIKTAVPFLLLPVLTAYLSERDYGTLSLFQALVALAVPLTPFNLEAAVQLAYFRERKRDLGSYISSALRAPVGITALLVLLLVPASASISQWTGLPRVWVAAVPLFGLAQLFPLLLLKLYQVRRRPWGYAGFNLAMAGLNLGLSCWAVVWAGWGWQGRMGAVVAAHAAFSVAAITILWQQGLLGQPFRRGFLLDAGRFCLLLVPHSLSGVVMAFGDRFLLSAMVGVEAVGSYAVGHQIGSAVLIASTSINQAWAPHLFGRLGAADTSAKTRLVRQTYCLALGLVLFCCVFFFALPVLFRYFVAPEFADSARYTAWIAVAGLFNGFYALIGNYMLYEKKTHWLSSLTAGGAALNVALNVLWIPRFGVIGAAYAAVTSSVLFFLLCWAAAQRAHPMPWRLAWARTTNETA